MNSPLPNCLIQMLLPRVLIFHTIWCSKSLERKWQKVDHDYHYSCQLPGLDQTACIIIKINWLSWIKPNSFVTAKRPDAAEPDVGWTRREFHHGYSSRSLLHHPQEQRRRRPGRHVWLAVNGAVSILAFSREKSMRRCLGKSHWLITPLIFFDHGLMLNASLRQEQH